VSLVDTLFQRAFVEAVLDGSCREGVTKVPRETKEARKERYALEEWQMIDLLRRAGNTVVAEVGIVADRKWRVDYLVRGMNVLGAGVIALEIEGYGRHHSWAGWQSDLEKYNAIAACGWLLIRVTRDMISSGDALEVLSRAGVRVESCERVGEGK
jgi:hypothetical protein